MLKQADKILLKAYFIFMVIFFVSIFCALRAISSISMMGLVAIALAANRLRTGRWWNARYLTLFSAGCGLFFLLQIVALLYTANRDEELKAIQLKSVLIAAPVLAPYLLYIGRDNWRRLMLWYVYTLLAATLYCLIHAALYFTATGDSTIFFYHPLVSVYSQHAVQFSIFVFAAIVFLKEYLNRQPFTGSKWWYWVLILYFSVFLLLLSSKLIIIITGCYFLYESLLHRRLVASGKGTVISLVFVIAAGCFLFFVKNPISDRFILETSGKLAFINQKQFSPADYFTGTQFRLLQWRFTGEILTSKGKWWQGVTAGDAQACLDQKYVSMNMFTGGAPDNKNGFLGYDTHNQFLQSVLENGIPGLLTFLMACAGMICMAVKKKDIQFSFLTIIIISYSFAEALWETQYGLILFVFFPLLFYYRAENREA